MNVDNEIQKLTSESFALKLEINSNYCTHQLSNMLNERKNVKLEIRKLMILKQRRLKINKIMENGLHKAI